MSTLCLLVDYSWKTGCEKIRLALESNIDAMDTAKKIIKPEIIRQAKCNLQHNLRAILVAGFEDDPSDLDIPIVTNPCVLAWQYVTSHD
jgi:hypothetical protein